MDSFRTGSRRLGKYCFTKTILYYAAIMLMAGGLVSPLPGWATQEGPQPATIEVEAEGEVMAKPDVATLVLAVETQAAQIEEARAANARTSEVLLKAIKSILQAEEKIQSVSYRIFPIYQRREKVQAGQKIRTEEVAGYKAAHMFRLELRDLSRIGQMADAALKNGANRVQGPYFDHTQKEKLQQQAAVKALKRAQELAEVMAQAANLKVKRLQKVSTAPQYRPIRAAAPAAVMAPAEAVPETPIEVGEEKFQARITAVFEVNP